MIQPNKNAAMAPTKVARRFRFSILFPFFDCRVQPETLTAWFGSNPIGCALPHLSDKAVDRHRHPSQF
ncbi:MAG: hypothetical protein OEX14_13045, partial [Paracoccaceae bacterium]|nr:hypothetical protein [Paracoccaceae bacterium]